MTLYAAIKSVHVSCASLTFISFLVRGVWMLRAPENLEHRWIRIVPHLIDALLLASALALIVLTRQYPGPTAWLNAKLAAVVVYILLGTVALKRGRTRHARTIAWLAALGTFGYIVAVALTHRPIPVPL